MHTGSSLTGAFYGFAGVFTFPRTHTQPGAAGNSAAPAIVGISWYRPSESVTRQSHLNPVVTAFLDAIEIIRVEASPAILIDRYGHR
jgi:hypothetical protein